MPPAVIRADVVVVVNPVLVAGVVGRVDVDNADFPGMGGFEQAQRIEVVAFDDDVSVRLFLTYAFGTVTPFFHQSRQYQVGVEHRITLNGAGFPIQSELLPREMFHKQATQLLLVQVFELGKQAVSTG